MNRDKIIHLIAHYEDRFDDQMQAVEAKRNEEEWNCVVRLESSAANSNAILSELRHRLAIIDGKDLV